MEALMQTLLSHKNPLEQQLNNHKSLTQQCVKPKTEFLQKNVCAERQII